MSEPAQATTAQQSDLLVEQLIDCLIQLVEEKSKELQLAVCVWGQCFIIVILLLLYPPFVCSTNEANFATSALATFNFLHLVITI